MYSPVARARLKGESHKRSALEKLVSVIAGRRHKAAQALREELAELRTRESVRKLEEFYKRRELNDLERKCREFERQMERRK